MDDYQVIEELIRQIDGDGMDDPTTAHWITEIERGPAPHEPLNFEED